MSRGTDRDHTNGHSSHHRTSRLSSTIEVPHHHNRRSTDRDLRRDSPEPPGRRSSPSYASYSPRSRDRRYDDRNDFSNPRGSPRSRNGRYGTSERIERPMKPFLDREYKNGRAEESESDEELKGLSYEEYRRLKRMKLRKYLKNCIWRITPSPPRGEWEEAEAVEEAKEEAAAEEEKKDEERKDEERKFDSDSESDSGSESESDDSGLRRKKESERKRKKGSGRKRKSKSSSSRKRRSKSLPSDTDSEDSEDESDGDSHSKKSRSRQARRARKRSRRSSKKSRKRDSDESGSEESESEKSDSTGSSEDDRRSKKRKGSSASRSKRSKKMKQSGSVSESSGKSLSGSDVDAKKIAVADDGTMKDEMNSDALAYREILELQKKSGLESEDVVGPMPLPKAEGHISYGGALRPGEGDAIAQYVQQGKRIPRRGEVGLSADEIQKFEDLGYVMSGSRHQRMNAIRIRKENQVYSAEDKRALAMFNYEEKAKREHKVMADLNRLVQRHIGEDVGPTHDPFGGKATDDADG